MFGAVRVLLAAEDHGAGTQYVRFRMTPRYSRAAISVALALLGLAATAALDGAWIAAALVGVISAAFLGRSVLECAVASAAARGCMADVEELEEGAPGVVLAHLAVDRAGGPLQGSRASMKP